MKSPLTFQANMCANRTPLKSNTNEDFVDVNLVTPLIEEEDEEEEEEEISYTHLVQVLDETNFGEGHELELTSPVKQQQQDEAMECSGDIQAENADYDNIFSIQNHSNDIGKGSMGFYSNFRVLILKFDSLQVGRRNSWRRWGNPFTVAGEGQEIAESVAENAASFIATERSESGHQQLQLLPT